MTPILLQYNKYNPSTIRPSRLWVQVGFDFSAWGGVVAERQIQSIRNRCHPRRPGQWDSPTRLFYKRDTPIIPARITNPPNVARGAEACPPDQQQTSGPHHQAILLPQAAESVSAKAEHVCHDGLRIEGLVWDFGRQVLGQGFRTQRSTSSREWGLRLGGLSNSRTQDESYSAMC